MCRVATELPALTAIIKSKPKRNPPTVAARTNALTPSAAPICRMNCWQVVALPMRATGTLFWTTTVSAGENEEGLASIYVNHVYQFNPSERNTNR